MGLIYYVCEDCKKMLGFKIDDQNITGEHEIKIKGSCCNTFDGDEE